MNSSNNNPSPSVGETSDELATLMPQPIKLTLGSRTIDITPIRVNEITPLTRAVAPIFEALQTLRANDDAPDWLALVGEHTEAVVDTVALATRCPKDWVEGLTVGELVLLAAKVVEVNADFLTRGVWPMLGSTVALLTRSIGTLTQTPGQTPGPPGATATPGAMPSSS
jgi:hypothetical protein